MISLVSRLVDCRQNELSCGPGDELLATWGSEDLLATWGSTALAGGRPDLWDGSVGTWHSKQKDTHTERHRAEDTCG